MQPKVTFLTWFHNNQSQHTVQNSCKQTSCSLPCHLQKEHGMHVQVQRSSTVAWLCSRNYLPICFLIVRRLVKKLIETVTSRSRVLFARKLCQSTIAAENIQSAPGGRLDNTRQRSCTTYTEKSSLSRSPLISLSLTHSHTHMLSICLCAKVLHKSVFVNEKAGGRWRRLANLILC